MLQKRRTKAASAVDQSGSLVITDGEALKRLSDFHTQTSSAFWTKPFFTVSSGLLVDVLAMPYLDMTIQIKGIYIIHVQIP